MRTVFNSFFNIFPFTYGCIGQLLIVGYFYAQLGVLIFGGIMTSDIDPSNWNLNNTYIYLNFNNFSNAMIFIFHLLIVNNYNYTVL